MEMSGYIAKGRKNSLNISGKFVIEQKIQLHLKQQGLEIGSLRRALLLQRQKEKRMKDDFENSIEERVKEHKEELMELRKQNQANQQLIQQQVVEMERRRKQCQRHQWQQKREQQQQQQQQKLQEIECEYRKEIIFIRQEVSLLQKQVKEEKEQLKVIVNLKNEAFKIKEKKKKEEEEEENEIKVMELKMEKQTHAAIWKTLCKQGEVVDFESIDLGEEEEEEEEEEGHEIMNSIGEKRNFCDGFILKMGGGDARKYLAQKLKDIKAMVVLQMKKGDSNEVFVQYKREDMMNKPKELSIFLKEEGERKNLVSVDWAADFGGSFKMTKFEQAVQTIIKKLNSEEVIENVRFVREKRRGGRSNECSTCMFLGVKGNGLDGLIKVKVYDKIAKFLQTDGRRERIVCGFRHIIQGGIHQSLMKQGEKSGIVRIEVQIMMEALNIQKISDGGQRLAWKIQKYIRKKLMVMNEEGHCILKQRAIKLQWERYWHRHRLFEEEKEKEKERASYFIQSKHYLSQVYTFNSKTKIMTGYMFPLAAAQPQKLEKIINLMAFKRDIYIINVTKNVYAVLRAQKSCYRERGIDQFKISVPVTSQNGISFSHMHISRQRTNLVQMNLGRVQIGANRVLVLNQGYFQQQQQQNDEMIGKMLIELSTIKGSNQISRAEIKELKEKEDKKQEMTAAEQAFLEKIPKKECSVARTRFLDMLLSSKQEQRTGAKKYIQNMICCKRVQGKAPTYCRKNLSQFRFCFDSFIISKESILFLRAQIPSHQTKNIWKGESNHEAIQLGEKIKEVLGCIRLNMIEEEAKAVKTNHIGKNSILYACPDQFEVASDGASVKILGEQGVIATLFP